MKTESSSWAALCGCLLLVFLSWAATCSAADDIQATLDVLPGGSFQTANDLYATPADYYQSDEFIENNRRCGTRISGDLDALVNGLPRSASDCTLSVTSISVDYYLTRILLIPVVFHVITQSDGTTGNVTDQEIRDQIQVLNQDFMALAGTLGSSGYNTKIQFSLAGITRSASDYWFADSAAAELAYKTALGWDQGSYLNIYTNSAGGYLGYTYLPQEKAGDVYDGLVILYSTVGGRDQEGEEPYEQGRTTVHEAGHYFGLLHTFEGGCTNTYSTGDLIVDTNAEAEEHYGCTQTSTCSSTDPIHNYMNYTDDSCMQEFTEEQSNRMVCALLNYRPNLYSVLIPGAGAIPLLLGP
jgi:hypothetical protein